MELFSFLNLHQFDTQIEVILPNVRRWQVRKMPLVKRHQVILDYEGYLRLFKIATAQSLQFQPSEIVSWLDNILMLDRLIKRFPPQLIHRCSLVLEYHLIPSLKRMDALLYHDGKNAILETSYDDGTNNEIQELAQLKTYQECLRAQLGNISLIRSFWMPIKPEYDEVGQVLNPTTIPQNDQILDATASKLIQFLS